MDTQDSVKFELAQSLSIASKGLRAAWSICRKNNMHETAGSLADTILDVEDSIKIALDSLSKGWSGSESQNKDDKNGLE